MPLGDSIGKEAIADLNRDVPLWLEQLHKLIETISNEFKVTIIIEKK